ncbi:pseudouridine synthase [Rubrivirga sp. IMCC43871]|uniref:pseudouridine synthase n=1 Tax=Rubrivirga sp. IMCC43871 TaxID=3391575 RepID=UPI0039901899
MSRKPDADSIRRRAQAGRKQRAAPPVAPRPEPEGPVRLNKFLARAGIAARREADSIIADGRVSVNGAVTTEMGVKVGPDDHVEVDGQPVRPTGLVYVLLNKPLDTITTVTDDRGRQTVLDLISIPDRLKKALFPVGRLDRDTTGALLLTTDGELGHRLMHPSFGAEKLYIVETNRPLDDADIARLRRGVDLDDGPARADNATFIGDDKRKFALQLHEGRNRQVRRMVEALDRRVVTLERVGYAGLDLTNLRRGRWRRLEPHEVNSLRRAVKLKPIVF